tara:strand:- start:347 stop:745 length:399 start_codon:yes stop_codon:yes gene_type:complete
MKYSLKDVCYLVEANSFEKSILFEKFHLKNENPIEWKDGIESKTVALNYNGDSIVFVIFIEELDGIPVAFWHSTSLIVHYGMIEDYFKKEAPHLYEGSRFQTTDANNFHNCIHYIKNMDKTKFKIKNNMEIF